MTYITKIIFEGEVFKIKKTKRNFTLFYYNHKPINYLDSNVGLISNSKVMFI